VNRPDLAEGGRATWLGLSGASLHTDREAVQVQLPNLAAYTHVACSVKTDCCDDGTQIQAA
jgi:hypothetical protein